MNGSSATRFVWFRFQSRGSANGNRTRISALKGPRANRCTIAPEQNNGETRLSGKPPKLTSRVVPPARRSSHHETPALPRPTHFRAIFVVENTCTFGRLTVSPQIPLLQNYYK